MKKLLAVSLTIMILGTLGGCGKQDTQEPPKVEIDYGNSELYTQEPPKVEIDYGNSELYTQEDMDAAIQVIEAEFATWEGCELHSLAYGGDAACSDENIEWLNGLEMKEQTEPFTQCILFSSSFHSPVEQRDAWDADTEYEGWQWWLGRSDGGAWELVTCGYG